MNGLLIAGTMALCVWLWADGGLTLGAITLASGLAIRIATMSGWIMWTSIGIFDNVGAVQEGMETIARPQELVDRPGAVPLAGDQGRDPLRPRQLPLRPEGRRSSRTCR